MADKQPALAASGPDRDAEDQLSRYKAWFRADRDHSAPWRKQAKEDFEFLAGEQWSDQDKATLKEQMRPIITFNRTNPIINAISGMEIQNRQEVKYFPREEGDVTADEVLTSAAEWFRDQSNGDDEDSDMFLDCTVCGLGGTETTLSFDEDEAGTPSISCMNPLELYWDHAARKKNYTDSTRRWRVRQVPLAKARAMADSFEAGKQFSDADLDAMWAAQDKDDAPIDRERARLYADEGERAHARDETMVTIVHLQHIAREPVWMVTDPTTGQKAEVPEDKYQLLQERAAKLGMPIIAQKTMKRRVKTCIIGDKILLETDALCPDTFQFQFVTAFLDRNTGLPYGMMRIMKDPQRWANKWMSQAMHILNTNAKGGVMLEEDAVEDVRDFERTWPRNDKVTVVAPGALSGGSPKIVPKNQPSMDGSFFNMMEFAINSVRDVTGVNTELLGMREATQAASLEAQRRQAAVTNLQPLFDNLKRYRRDEGKTMLYIIQKVIPKIDAMMGGTPRLIRIVGEAGAKYVPLAIKADAVYDVIIDDQPTSPDRNMDVLRILSPYMGSFPPGVMLALLDLLPIPTSVKDKIRQASQPQGEPPPDPAIVAAQAKAQTDEKKIDAQSQVDMEKLQATSANDLKKAIIDALTRIEVAQISAGVDDNSTQVEAQLSAMMGAGQMANDHALQARQHSHERRMQQEAPQPQPAGA